MNATADDELLAYHLAKIELLRMEKLKGAVRQELDREIAQRRRFQPLPEWPRKQAG